MFDVQKNYVSVFMSPTVSVVSVVSVLSVFYFCVSFLYVRS